VLICERFEPFFVGYGGDGYYKITDPAFFEWGRLTVV
jgi:hypothetical protein